jgi:hypothetical protein
LIAFFLGWLMFSIVIVSTELIDAPARGIFFRLCLLATPFALGSALGGVVLLTRRRDQIRSAEVQRADAMREPRR